MARDPNAEPLFPTDVIQGDILVGLPKRSERMLFFRHRRSRGVQGIPQRPARYEHARVHRATRHHQPAKEYGNSNAAPNTRVERGFHVPRPGEARCRRARRVAELEAFRDGMAARTVERQTVRSAPDPAYSAPESPSARGVHRDRRVGNAEVADTIAERLAPVPGNGWHILHTEVGRVRPDPVRGHEHFGFADGLSQPGRARSGGDRQVAHSAIGLQ